MRRIRHLKPNLKQKGHKTKKSYSTGIWHRSCTNEVQRKYMAKEEPLLPPVSEEIFFPTKYLLYFCFNKRLYQILKSYHSKLNEKKHLKNRLFGSVAFSHFHIEPHYSNFHVEFLSVWFQKVSHMPSTI